MERERNMNQIFWVMAVLNLAIIVYYCLISTVTIYRICDSFAAYDFLNSVRQLPKYPWQMPLWSVSLYLILCVIGNGKLALSIDRLWSRLMICIVEIILCVSIIASLNFYYSGVALLVLADLVHYIHRNHIRAIFIAVLVCLYAFAQFEIASLAAAPIPFSAYLGYYDQSIRGIFTGIETVLVSANVLLFVLSMILLFTGERAENERIRKLNEQLNDANTKLRDYAVELEYMTEVRERNRLAREIHDTLGHTLTGIIMGADAATALFAIDPEESQKRIQVIAQSAREGLTDVRRSIKALRVDALEQNTLSEALAELVDKFRMSTGVEIEYQQLAGHLNLAPDEEDFIYRVVQESMTNSVRHGHAKKIEITIIRHENILTVDVQDDGDGVDQIEEGFGLRHMRERLDLLGGVLSFGNRSVEESGEHKGFFITVNMPIRKREG